MVEQVMKRSVQFYFIIILLILSPFCIYGQEEAPATLFETQIGDADVDLTARGFWDVSLLGSLGFAFDSSESSPYSYPFPGMIPGFYFKQVPDITLSLYLMNRYFFETSLKEDTSLNTFLLGYNGLPGEFVQKVRLGNTEIDIDDYSLLSVSSSPNSSLGGSALFQTPSSDHEILLRFEPAELKRKSFLGGSALIEEEFSLFGYDTGRLFILPDNSVENPAVYIEDGEGPLSGSDGSFYRKAGPDDIFLDPYNGTLFTASPPQSKILIYYTKEGKAVGDPSLGRGALAGTDVFIDIEASPRDFSWDMPAYLGIETEDFQVKVGDSLCLRLFEPGTFSPFEHTGIYTPETEVNTIGSSSLYLKDKSSTNDRGTEIPFQTGLFENSIVLLRLSENLREPANRYPFADIYPELYGPVPSPQPGYIQEYLLFEYTEDIDEYSLDTTIVEGSVTVRINGKKTSLYSVDYDTGVLSFSVPVRNSDRIDVTYKTNTPSETGNLVFGLGNRFTLSPEWEIEAGTGINWNMKQGGYTTAPYENPGRILITGGADYTGDYSDVSLHGGVSFSTPDTTGVYRIEGMEDEALSVTFNGNSLFPSSVPLDPVNSYSLLPENRGILYYKDYHLYTRFSGNALQEYTWKDIPDSQISPYESGTKPGPYPALVKSALYSGTAGVMDFVLNSRNSWVGGQVPLNLYGSNLDLSQYTSISMYLLKEGNLDNCEIYLQIGTLGENLDSDLFLDAESSELSSGYSFNDQGSGNVFILGTNPQNSPNGVKDSEDINGNGILDREKGNSIATYGPVSQISSAGEYITFTFTEAERTALKSASGIRLLIINADNTPASGKLLFGDINFAGSPFMINSPPSVSAEAEQIPEASVNSTAEKLEDAFPETLKSFHGQDLTQKVLEISWDNCTDDSQIVLSGYLPPVPLDNYKNMNFFFRSEGCISSGEDLFAIDLTDSGGKGLHGSFPFSKINEWSRITLDLENKELLINGEPFPEGVFLLEENTGPAATLNFSLSGCEEGKIYLDELYLDTSRVKAGVKIEGTFSYIHPDPVLMVRNVPLIENIEVQEEVSASSLYFDEGGSETGGLRSATHLQSDILYCQLGIDLDFFWNYNTLYRLSGHDLRIPAVSSPVTFFDSFYETSDSELSEDRSLFRSNVLLLSPLPWCSLRFNTETETFSSDLSQAWSGALSLIFPEYFSSDVSISFRTVLYQYSADYRSYFENWILGYRFIVPQKSSQNTDRTVSGLFNTAAETYPLGIDLSAEGESSVRGTAPRFQANSGSMELSFPILFGDMGSRTWSVTPGYMRGYSNTSPLSGDGTYGEDIRRYFHEISTSRHIYSLIPFLELFYPKSAVLFLESTEGLLSAEYSPSMFLELTRPYGSFLYDVFVPSLISFTLQRDLTREEAGPLDSTLYDITLRSTALNLFGQFGAYSLTDFYKTDEFNTSISWALDHDNFEKTNGISLVVQHLLLFFGRNDVEFKMDNRFSRTWDISTGFSENISVSYTWRNRKDLGFTIPEYFPVLSDSPFFQHTEGLELMIEGSKQEDKTSGFSLLLSHSTSLVLPDAGDLRALLSLGFDKASSAPFLLGIQGGLEAHFSF